MITIELTKPYPFCNFLQESKSFCKFYSESSNFDDFSSSFFRLLNSHQSVFIFNQQFLLNQESTLLLILLKRERVDLKRYNPNSFHGSGMVLDGPLYGTVIPYLEFSIEFQSNNLIYHKEYTKRQQIIYVLIKYLHDKEGWGYRKISKWLNKSGIKIHRGKNWFSLSSFLSLKEKTRKRSKE